MKSKLNLVALDFPFLKKFKSNSTIFKIIKAFCISFFISNSIYLSNFENFYLELISPFVAIYGFVLLLRSEGKVWFLAGFFFSLLWFYWIALSSLYYNLHYIIPLELLAIGLVYAICFRLCYAFKFAPLRLGGLFALQYLHIFGFDWLNWGILSVYGFFDTSLRGVVCIFLIAYFWYEGYISRYYKIFIIVMIFFIGMQYKDAEFTPLQSDIKLINTDIDEANKFTKENVAKNADFVVSEILQAINEQKELIVFPESTFAFELQKGFGGMYYELLREFSSQIQIIVGAPYEDEGKFYNSAYIFKDNQVQIMSKHYLVAFGEETSQIPYIGKFVRTYLLPNVIDFTRGDKLNQYFIGNQLVTNAICYEVTKEELYTKSQIIIAISNNAWFDNFVEPALQKLLIKFYASKYGVIVYHATNAKETAIITPKKSPLLKIKTQLFGVNSAKITDNKNASPLFEDTNSTDMNESAENLDYEMIETNQSIINTDKEMTDTNQSAIYEDKNQTSKDAKKANKAKQKAKN